MAIFTQAVAGHTDLGRGESDSRPHPRRRWRIKFTAIAVAGDALVGGLASGTVLNITPHPSGVMFQLVPLVLAVMWVAWLGFGGAYDWNLFGEGVEEYRRVAVAGLVAVGVVAVVNAMLEPPEGRGMVFGLLAATCLTVVWRRCLRGVLHRRRRSGQGMNRALLVGPTHAVEATAHMVSQTAFHGTKVVAALIPPGDPAPMSPFIPQFDHGGDIPSAVDAYDVDEVVLLRPVDLDSLDMRDLMWSLAEREVNLLIRPMSLHVAGPRLTVRPVDGLPLLHIAHPQITGLARAVKGAVDRALAGLGLLMLLPVLLVIASVIKMGDRGPVFYKHTRVGENGKHFRMFKFRSMQVDADARLAEVQANNVHPDGVLTAIVNDPRVTPIGRFLRRYSLDELPQLINVVRGEMALVGPRPPLPGEVESYPDHGWFRMAVRPGLTGLWQIKGPDRHFLSLDEALELDLRYVENWSLSYDLAILWKTIAVVIRGSGEVKSRCSSAPGASPLPPMPRALPDS